MARELDAIIAARTKPIMTVSGNELTGMAIVNWTRGHGIEWHYIARGNQTWRRDPASGPV